MDQPASKTKARSFRAPLRSTLILHVSIGLSALLGVSCGDPPVLQPPPETSATEQPAVHCDQVTEITLERAFSICTDCPAYKVVLSQQPRNTDESVAVALTDLKTNQTRHGTLYQSTFDQLCRLIESERYFELSDAYGESVLDSVEVTSSVVKNGVRKTIVNRAQKGPIELWGIEMAIEGAVATSSINSRSSPEVHK